MIRKSSGPIISFTRFTYYYHPDYLGHVEYITDNLGVPYQYFWYSPWGESFKEQISTTQQHGFTSPYRFNGKELDHELSVAKSRIPLKNNYTHEQSGLYYYGARYYNPTMSVWLVVDPLAHEFPHQSPYVFTDNNPIMLVDPDGRSPEGIGDFFQKVGNFIVGNGWHTNDEVAIKKKFPETNLLKEIKVGDWPKNERNTQENGSEQYSDSDKQSINWPIGKNKEDPIDNPVVGGGPGKWGANL